MDKELSTRLAALVDTAKKTGFVIYNDLSSFFPDSYTGGLELDNVLSQFELAGVKILRNRGLVSLDYEPVLTQWEEPGNSFITDDPLRAYTDDPLQVYTEAVAEVPRLTSVQEAELFDVIMKGNFKVDTAKRQLLEAHLWRVIVLAKPYQAPGIYILDLIEKGNAGLLTAGSTFKTGRGYTFATYATFWVHRTLHDLVSKTRA